MKYLKRISILLVIVMAFACAFSLTACGGEPANLTKILIQYPANTLDYVVGETFDKTGMVVVGIYDDGSTEIINDYSIDKTGALTAEDNKITISYEGFTAEQAITCIPANEKVLLEFNAIGSRMILDCYADLTAKMIVGGYGMATESGTWSYVGGVLTINLSNEKNGPLTFTPELNAQGAWQFVRDTMTGANKTFVIDADVWKPVLEGKTFQ